MSDGIHILQIGVPRSGNVWLQRLVRGLLEEAGVEVRQAIRGHPVAEALKGEELAVRGLAEADFLQIGPLGTFFAIPGVFRWPVVDLDDYVSRTTCVSSHSPWNAGSAEVYRRFSHLIYIVRDPRDVALSTSRFFYTPFNRLHRPQPWPDSRAFLLARYPEIARSWMEHVRGHLAKREGLRMHVVFYERLIERTTEELEAISRFLDLTLDAAALERTRDLCRLSRMRTEYPGHIHRGEWGGWREELDAPMVGRIARIAGADLSSLAYPVTVEEAGDWLASATRPTVPSRAGKEDVEAG